MSTAKLMFTAPDHGDKQAALNTEYRGHKEAVFGTCPPLGQLRSLKLLQISTTHFCSSTVWRNIPQFVWNADMNTWNIDRSRVWGIMRNNREVNRKWQLRIAFDALCKCHMHQYSLVWGKAIPLQAWTGLEGSGKLRLPDFKTVSIWRW